MTIYSLLSERTVLPDLSVKDKSALLNKLIDVFSERLDEEQLNTIRNAVFEREEIMSTGVGKGLAIPHGKANIDESYASFAILAHPIDYESIDQIPVQLVFLLVGPLSKNSTHIKLLSRISRLMNNSSFRDRLIKCKTSHEIVEAFREEEEKYFDK